MATTVGPTTPLELVETAYARYPRALADARRLGDLAGGDGRPVRAQERQGRFDDGGPALLRRHGEPPLDVRFKLLTIRGRHRTPVFAHRGSHPRPGARIRTGGVLRESRVRETSNCASD